MGKRCQVREGMRIGGSVVSGKIERAWLLTAKPKRKDLREGDFCLVRPKFRLIRGLHRARYGMRRGPTRVANQGKMMPKPF